MDTHELRKHVSFKCGNCESAAKVVTGDEDGRMKSVFCPSCDTSLEGENAGLMYDELIKRYRFQEARNISRRIINKRGVGRVPLTKVDNEFSDPKWPFILKIEADV